MQVQTHSTPAAPPVTVRVRAKVTERKPRRSVAEKYLEEVLEGKHVVSKWVRRQVEIHAADLSSCVVSKDGTVRGLYFDRKAAQHVIDFFAQFLVHTEGEYDGLPFILEPWQQGFLWVLYGWKRAGTGYRRYKSAYLEIGRGNGKSALASGLCLYELVGFGEPGAQVYSAATDKKTAKLVFDTADLMVLRSPALNARIRRYTNNLHIPGTAAKFEPLASEDSNLMGLRPSFAVLDELHVQKTSGVRDVIVSAMGKRRNPLLFEITNSGFDQESVCYKEREYTIKVLEGVVPDDTRFGWVCGLDEEDIEHWEDERNWPKANPSLGSMVRLEFLRDQALKAKADPSTLNTFLRMHLSVWTTSHSVWMPLEKWDRCDEVVDRDVLKGRACFVGLDLSSTNDITAAVAVFPPTAKDAKWRVLPEFFVPAEAIEERARKARVPYDVWARQGLLQKTPGAVVDYGYIRKTLHQWAEEFAVKEVVYDRWNSSDLVRDLKDDGLTLEPFGQGYASMNAPTKRLMELVLSGELAHGGNPVLRWMVTNAIAKMDPAGNIKLDKEASREKIDGVVATVMGIGRAMQMTQAPTPEPRVRFL